MLFAFFVTAFRYNKRCPEAMEGPLVGLSYVAFSSAIMAATGGALDTWFYLAPAFLHGRFGVECLIYFVGPPLGAICGHFLYNMFADGGSGGGRSGLNRPLVD